mgnify:CR=1 FL=1
MLSKKAASELVELEGTKVKDSTLYIYVRLFNSDIL